MNATAKNFLFVIASVGIAMLGKRLILLPMAEKVPAVAPAVALIDKVVP